MLNKKLSAPTSGFTLVELILYVSISSAMLLVVVFFVSLLLSARIHNQSINEVEDQGNFVLSLITQTARNANSINTPAVGANASSLSLAMPDIAVSPAIFSLSGGRIFITEGGGASVALTNNQVTVNSFTVQNVSLPATAGTIQIKLILSRVNQSGRREYSYQQTFVGSATIRK